MLRLVPLAMVCALLLGTSVAPAVAAPRPTLEVVPAAGGPPAVVARVQAMHDGLDRPRWAADGASLITTRWRTAKRGRLATDAIRYPTDGTPPALLGALTFDLQHVLDPTGVRYADVVDGAPGEIVVREVGTGRVTARLAHPASGDDLYEGGLEIAWSGDGARVAVLAPDSEGESGMVLAVMEATTGRVLVRRRVPYGARLSATGFSPDGRRLVLFEIDRQERSAVLDVETRVLRRLPSWFGDEVSAAVWSPDATRLALRVGAGIALVDPVSGWGQIIPVTSQEELSVGDIAWKPDGSAIAYALDRYVEEGDDPRASIQVIGLLPAPSPPRPVTGRARTIFQGLSWSPTGDRLAYWAQPSW